MVACAVNYCKRRSETSNLSKDGVSYHTFPNNRILRKEWTDFCNRSDSWGPTVTSVICSDHFDPCSFLPQGKLNRRRLNAAAKPTIYKDLPAPKTPESNDNQTTTSTSKDNDSSKPSSSPAGSPIELDVKKVDHGVLRTYLKKPSVSKSTMNEGNIRILPSTAKISASSTVEKNGTPTFLIIPPQNSMAIGNQCVITTQNPRAKHADYNQGLSYLLIMPPATVSAEKQFAANTNKDVINLKPLPSAESQTQPVMQIKHMLPTSIQSVAETPINDLGTITGIYTHTMRQDSIPNYLPDQGKQKETTTKEKLSRRVKELTDKVVEKEKLYLKLHNRKKYLKQKIIALKNQLNKKGKSRKGLRILSVNLTSDTESNNSSLDVHTTEAPITTARIINTLKFEDDDDCD